MTSRDVPGAAAEGLWAPRAAARAGSSEQVLDALDPEQREVALALSRAGRGARGRRHRQDPRDHAPHRLRRAHGPARPAPHAGGHVHRARRRRDAAPARRARRRGRAGPHLPLGGAAAAALLLAPRGRRRRARDPAEQGADPRRRCCAAPASTDTVARARRRGRDRVGEGEPGRRPPTTSRAAVRARREPPGVAHAATTSPTLYAAYDDRKTADGFIDFEDVLLLTVGMLDTRLDIAEEVRAQYRWFVVDEYQDVNPLQQRLLDLWLGERDDLCVVGDASQTIYTFTGATLVLPRSTSARGSRTPPRCGSCASTAPRRRSCRWPTGCSRASTGAGGAAAARAARHARRRPRARGHGVRRRAGRGGGRRGGGRAADRRGHARARDRGALPDQRAVGGVRGGARPRRASPTCCAASRRSSSAARCARRSPGCAVRRGGGERPASSATDVRSVLSAMGWTPSRRAARVRSASGGRTCCALVTLADDLAARPTRRPRLADLVADLDQRAATQSRADRRRRHPRHGARGQGPRVGRGVRRRAWSQGTFPIQYADTPARVEEERRLFYVACTRARTHLALSWARSRTGRGRRDRSPFLDAVFGAEPVERGRRQGGVVPRHRLAHARGARRSPATCRVCGTALVSGRSRRAAAARTCPSSYDEALLRAAQGLAQGRGEPPLGAGVRRVHRRHARAGGHPPARVIPGRCSRSRGSAPASSRRYGEAVLALVRGEDPPRPQTIRPIRPRRAIRRTPTGARRHARSRSAQLAGNNCFVPTRDIWRNLVALRARAAAYLMHLRAESLRERRGGGLDDRTNSPTWPPSCCPWSPAPRPSPSSAAPSRVVAPRQQRRRHPSARHVPASGWLRHHGVASATPRRSTRSLEDPLGETTHPQAPRGRGSRHREPRPSCFSGHFLTRTDQHPHRRHQPPAGAAAPSARTPALARHRGPRRSRGT